MIRQKNLWVSSGGGLFLEQRIAGGVRLAQIAPEADAGKLAGYRQVGENAGGFGAVKLAVSGPANANFAEAL
jgi:hypothetical protein